MDGNEYIDLLNGFGPIFFGHAPAFVTEAVAEQLKDGFEIGPQTPLAGEVAECCLRADRQRARDVLQHRLGGRHGRDALARTVTGRNKVVVFAGAYHGTFDEVLVKGVRRTACPTRCRSPGHPATKASRT